MFKNKEGKVHSGWKIAGMMGVTFLIFIIASTIVGIIAGFLIMPKLVSSGEINPDALVFTDSQMYLINTVSAFLQEIIMIAVPIIIWKFIIKRSLSEMGLKPVLKHSKELLVGLALGAASMTVVFLSLILSGSSEVVSWKPHFSSEQLVYLVLYIFVGFAEEIFSRGYMMSVMRQTKSISLIIFVPSIIFALLHSMNTGVGIIPYINLALVGVLFAVMYLRSGNLWMCIGYHITWNYFQGYVYGFKVSGQAADGIITTTAKKFSLLNGSAFGPEGGIFVTIIILVGLLFVYKYYKNSNYDFLASENAMVKQPEQPLMNDGNNAQM
jgi:membrane protease YdiL (CAAX protease family)